VSRNAYAGAKWLEMRELTKMVNATLRHQRQAVEGVDRDAQSSHAGGTGVAT
jgi:hypothetical protein